jgi:cytochrome b561
MKQENKYTPVAQLFHWSMFVLIAGLLALGFIMTDLPLSPEKLQYYSWHKWAGVTVFVLVWLRLLWRATHRPPAHPGSMTAFQSMIANWVHAWLYLLMIIIPVTGWILSSAKGVQTVWFGVLPLPDLVQKDKELGHFMHEVHETLNYLLMLTVALHFLAAIKHHVIDRDHILTSMLPNHKQTKETL